MTVPTALITPTVSHSEVTSFVSCERMHFYGYGMELEPITTAKPLIIGVLGHRTLEVYFTAILDGEPHELASERAKTYLLGQMTPFNTEEVKLVADAVNFFLKINPFNGWMVLVIEKEFVLDCGDYKYPFVVDLLLKDPRGRIVLVDHKFVYDFMSNTTMALQTQMDKYIGALRALGYNVEYYIYNMLRYRSIKEPTPDQKHRTVTFMPNDLRIQTSFREQMQSSDRLLARKQLSLEEQSYEAVRVANKLLCDRCNFATLCAAELNNDAVPLIMQSEYKKRERRIFNTTEDTP